MTSLIYAHFTHSLILQLSASSAWTSGHPQTLQFSMKMQGDEMNKGLLASGYKKMKKGLGYNDGTKGVRMDAWVAVGKALCETCPEFEGAQKLERDTPRHPWTIQRLYVLHHILLLRLSAVQSVLL